MRKLVRGCYSIYFDIVLLVVCYYGGGQLLKLQMMKLGSLPGLVPLWWHFTGYLYVCASILFYVQVLLLVSVSSFQGTLPFVFM